MNAANLAKFAQIEDDRMFPFRTLALEPGNDVKSMPGLFSAVVAAPAWPLYVAGSAPSITAARGSFWYKSRMTSPFQTAAKPRTQLIFNNGPEEPEGITKLDLRSHGRDQHPLSERRPLIIEPTVAARLYPLIEPWSLYQLACDPMRRDAAPSLSDFKYDCPYLGETVSLRTILETTLSARLKDAKLDPHQWETLQYCLTGDDTYVADDAGLGKTVSVLAYIAITRPLRTLIVSPSSAKYNWLTEYQRFLPDLDYHVQVIDADNARYEAAATGIYGHPSSNGTITIVNYDILDRLIPHIHNVTFDLLVCDEAKRLQNELSKRTCIVFGGTPQKATYENGVKVGYKSISALKRIFCDGTPLDKPRQLWPVFKAFDHRNIGSDLKEFERKYCGAFYDERGNYRVDGKVDLETISELGRNAKQRFMIRHNDTVLNLIEPSEEIALLDVPTEVREKLVSDEQDAVLSAIDALEEVDPDAAMELRRSILTEETKRTKSRTSALFDIVGTNFADQLTSVQARGPLVQILLEKMATIRRQTGEVKVPFAGEYILDRWKKNGCRPVIVFAYHKSVVQGIADYISGAVFARLSEDPDGLAADFKQGGMEQGEYTIVQTITGDTSASRRAQIKAEFQAGEIMFIVCNIAAAGEALTLTRSSTVIFAEPDWSARAMRQAWKRSHRRGQTEAVKVYLLFVDRTFDYNVSMKFLQKRAVQDAFFDEGDEDDDG